MADYDDGMPKISLILETTQRLKDVEVTDQELAELRINMASGSGTLEFKDGHGNTVVLAVQHIVEVVIDDEEANPMEG